MRAITPTKLSLWIAHFICLAFAVNQPALADDHSQTLNAKMQRVEANVVDMPMGPNEPPLRLDLLKLMNAYNVPALSVAIIDDFKVVFAKGYGVVEREKRTPVTTKTLFQAGSISKPVAAAGALSLVEQGKLSLTEDVNLKLKTWKVPDNEFTRQEKVTLQRLMSHTAGLTVHGFPGYEVGAPLPTITQVLNGEKPANTAPVRVDIVPGTQVRYSGGGVTIEQLLMTDVSGKPFPELMHELVLEKVGMSDSSYQQPLTAARAALTATGTYADGKLVSGRWHIYPEMAAAGLWTTPTDLCKFAIEIALSKHGKSNRVLSEAMTQRMLTPVMDEAALGFFMEKDNPGQFGHNGADEGFQALLTMNAETGNGIAIMADSDNGINVAQFLLRAVAKEYGWNYKTGGSNALPMLIMLSKIKGTQAALVRYDQLQKSPKPGYEVEESTLNILGYTLLQSGKRKDAITVFARNVDQYPKSSNVYDSLAEAYAQDGQTALAIKDYEKALELNPKNENAAKNLKKLKTQQ